VVGQVFFPDAFGADGAPGQAGVDDDGDGDTDFDTSGLPDLDEIESLGSDDNLNFGFVVIAGGTSGATEPTWDRTPGVTHTDGGVTWRCFDNRIGLEQIRITVRYRDVGTGQTRQVTLVHSMVD
jgi:hypothetical protein